MKTNMKSNLRKILGLMLAILGLATVLSIMPEHSRAYTASHADTTSQTALVQQ